MNAFRLYFGKNRTIRVSEKGIYSLRRHRIFGPLPFVRWEPIVRFDPVVMILLLSFFVFFAIIY